MSVDNVMQISQAFPSSSSSLFATGVGSRVTSAPLSKFSGRWKSFADGYDKTIGDLADLFALALYYGMWIGICLTITALGARPELLVSFFSNIMRFVPSYIGFVVGRMARQVDQELDVWGGNVYNAFWTVLAGSPYVDHVKPLINDVSHYTGRIDPRWKQHCSQMGPWAVILALLSYICCCMNGGDADVYHQI